jgi:hypothetical protein
MVAKATARLHKCLDVCLCVCWTFHTPMRPLQSDTVADRPRPFTNVLTPPNTDTRSVAVSCGAGRRACLLLAACCAPQDVLDARTKDRNVFWQHRVPLRVPEAARSCTLALHVTHRYQREAPKWHADEEACDGVSGESWQTESTSSYP